MQLSRRGSRGGGQGGLAPPPFSGGGEQGGQKPHTQNKYISKSDDHEARYRLKRTPKHTKYAQIFFKKSCEVGGGLRGHKGNILFIKVIKSRKWKKNARNIILFRCSKALYFHTFSNIFLSKCTFPAASHPVYYSTKKYSCHFYSFIISVYISNVFAIVSLITRFAHH